MSVPRFLADEDLRYEIVLAARRLDSAIDFPRVHELGLVGTSDADLLEYAAVEQRLVISHDVNTMRAAAEQRLTEGNEMRGLFLVPQTRPTRSVAESIVMIWSASQAEEWNGRIVYLPL